MGRFIILKYGRISDLFKNDIIPAAVCNHHWSENGYSRIAIAYCEIAKIYFESGTFIPDDSSPRI